MVVHSDCSTASLKDVGAALTTLLWQITLSAWNGQRLPQLTLFVLFHAFVHVAAFSGVSDTHHQRGLQYLSCGILSLSCLTCAAGYTLLIKIYRHSVTTIFNRKLPQTLIECLPSFSVHLALLRPLEILFRYATARFRVLPDILVLGEVRCGTTTLCQHLATLEGCVEPFCLWKHPELDRKETFYFVGHYLGSASPDYYRMCFPLYIVKWFCWHILRKPFFTYDGCAQYLTNPAVPYMIAKAYRDAGQSPPVLVACVRNPLDQALSWWRYENHAMLWGEGMGLNEWNAELRSARYPPRTIGDALDFSSSDKVRELYRKSEELYQNDCGGTGNLPSWAVTWPGGQLSGIGRNGCFAENIKRYERVFADSFPAGNPRENTAAPATSRLRYVNVVPLGFLRDDIKLQTTLESLVDQTDARNPKEMPKLRDNLSSDYHVNRSVHRNASVNQLRACLEPTRSEKVRLSGLFSDSVKELESLCGTKLGWS